MPRFSHNFFYIEVAIIKRTQLLRRMYSMYDKSGAEEGDVFVLYSGETQF
jgi:hypothetical protein